MAGTNPRPPFISDIDPNAFWFNTTALGLAADSLGRRIAAMGGIPTASPTDLSTSDSASAPSSATSPGVSPSSLPSPSIGVPITNYLIATISNANMQQIGTTQDNTSRQANSPNTGLAMIILYAITGCVTLLFLVVIMSGAIRAMRHPERYGPRARNLNGPGDSGQSRAGGLTKAILDTFPVVKYLSGNNTNREASNNREEDGTSSVDRDLRHKDLEEAGEFVEEVSRDHPANINSSSNSVPMYPIRTSREGTQTPRIESADVADQPTRQDAAQIAHHERETSEAVTLASASAHFREGTNATLVDEAHTADAPSKDKQSCASGGAAVDSTDPNDVNDSVTCPICLLDFEDGDDIRILPCNSKHRFHDAVSFVLSPPSRVCRGGLKLTSFLHF